MSDSLFETMAAVQRTYMELWGTTVVHSVKSVTAQLQISLEIMTAQTTQSLDLLRKTQETLGSVIDTSVKQSEQSVRYPDVTATTRPFKQSVNA